MVPLLFLFYRSESLARLDELSTCQLTAQKQQKDKTDEREKFMPGIQHLTSGTVSITFGDNPRPRGIRRRTISWQAPFIKPDREDNYRVARVFFADQQ